MFRYLQQLKLKTIPKRRESSSGFTIVETIIVLALAGLITVTVLFAVPSLSRNSRDTTRKSVVSRIRSELENYTSNNHGTQPFTNLNSCPANDTTIGDWANFYQSALQGLDIKDPGSHQNVISCPANTNVTTMAGYSTPTTGVLKIVTGAACSGGAPVADAGFNSYAMVIGLEKTGVRYCTDNK